jgi:hypothetical protein
VARDHLPGLALVNLDNADTNTRRGLLAAVSQALQDRKPLPEEPGDLSGFNSLISNRSGTMAGLMRFDLAPYRSCYDIDLFAALRYFIMLLQACCWEQRLLCGRRWGKTVSVRLGWPSG